MLKPLLSCLWLLVAHVGYAASEIVAAPAELQHCVVCHGVELIGNRSVDAPNLSVLSTWYVKQQLVSYRRGLRAPYGSIADLIGREMQPMAAALDDDGIAAVLAFVARVPERSAAATVNGDLTRGAKLYTSCVACHGARGEGNRSLNAPRLAGQSDWYLVRQLENYQTGARGTATDDISGALMRAATTTLIDGHAIDDVVSYINSLSQ